MSETSLRYEFRAKIFRLLDPAILVIGAIVFAVDQITKSMIVAAIGTPVPRSVEVLGDYVRLSFVTNSGSAFGLFQNVSGIISIISLVIVPALFLSRAFLVDPSLVVRICLGLLAGGALGNLVDRLRLGYVVDFVDVGIGHLRWPSFNVADSAFVVGVITIIVLTTLFGHSLDGSSSEGSQPQSPR